MNASELDQRRTKGSKTRKKILNATLQLIDQEGIGAVTTRKVAEMAGVSQSSLYHHFQSSDVLIVASLTSRVETRMTSVSIDQFNSPKEYLNWLFQMFLQQSKGPQAKGYFAVLDRARVNEEYRLLLTEMGQGLREQIKPNIEQIWGGPIEQEKMDLILFTFTLFREGAFSHNLLYGGKSPFAEQEKLAEQMVGLILQVLQD